MDILDIILWNKYELKNKEKFFNRPFLSKSDITTDIVNKIIEDVKKSGDVALFHYSNIFDKFNKTNFKVKKSRINNIDNYIDCNVKIAIQHSLKNIKKFHLKQKKYNLDIEIEPGVRCQHMVTPIESVGLYVPGGNFPLVSTILMLAIPANIAGCKNIVMCSPPPINDFLVYAAKICGVTKIYEIGGAQAIAALAIGTKSIPKVNKIFGPGNIYVTEAKIQVNNSGIGVSIDMPAGPSEVLIIADKFANSSFIASDFLSQLEHGIYSQAILLTDNINLAQNVKLEIKKQITSLSNYKIILQSLKNSFIIVTDNIHSCINISNRYCPEHLIIQTRNPRDILKFIYNAGSIFLGDWSPESAGDYASGTNHVLPTYGYASSYSGISLCDFQKRISVQELTSDGLLNLSKTIKILSKLENMDAHTNSIDIRLSSLKVK
ncbi:Histidinol dehydrogenase [Buchnera aphidicola (Neophyllaphis podocarpi)]|uniref:histidinol dehydrogenase n=1 Tax=Buchnera aphidicola TaxID=9 RepID=UPI003463BCB5